MSSYGARIVKRNPAPSDNAAGVKKVAKEGESNVNEIWPQMAIQNPQRGALALNTADINYNDKNERARKLNEKDFEVIQRAMRLRDAKSSNAVPYKNHSNVFTHL